jgi:hypothetical protein
MIERGPGDIIVTAKKAEELSRPKLTRKGKPKPPEAQVAGKVPDVETTGSITPSKPAGTAQGTAAAKTGPEPSGHGPDAREGEKLASETEGQKAESAAENGARRQVRVVGPRFISLPAQTPAD